MQMIWLHYGQIAVKYKRDLFLESPLQFTCSFTVISCSICAKNIQPLTVFEATISYLPYFPSTLIHPKPDMKVEQIKVLCYNFCQIQI